MRFNFTISSVIAGAVVLAGCQTTSPSGEVSSFVDTSKETLYQSGRTDLPKAGPNDVHIFAPKAQTSQTTILYDAWDEILNGIVFNMGPSTRQAATTPNAPTGTRFVLGHDSIYRLEGNRIFFSFFSDELIEALTEYRQELVTIGNKIDITRLSRNEQLVYWLNLYNVVTIETIAREYPVKTPSRMKFGENKTTFDDAKLIELRGVKLSLKDIRTRIVYPHWKSPDIIYGFFRGDIGGPRISTSAFNVYDVESQLSRNGDEFVNSLRGTTDDRSSLRVSRIYEEARPFFFPNWPADLKNHLKTHLEPEVLASLNFSAPVQYIRYETDIADLAGGEPQTSVASTQVDDITGDGFYYRRPGVSPQVARIYSEMQKKLETLKLRGWARGNVVIIDRPDLENNDGEVE